jgi:hypothetical protein
LGIVTVEQLLHQLPPLRPKPTPAPQTSILRENMASAIERFNKAVAGCHGVSHFDLRFHPPTRTAQLDMCLTTTRRAPVLSLRFSGVSGLLLPALFAEDDKTLFRVTNLHASNASHHHPGRGILYLISAGDLRFACLSFAMTLTARPPARSRAAGAAS